MSKRTKKQVKGGTACCIVGCRNKYTNTKHISLYTFPSETRFPGRRQLWLDAIRKSGVVNKNWDAPTNGRICNKHFRHLKKSDNPHDKDYTPSVFPTTSETQGLTKQQLDRYQRSQELHARKMMLLKQLPDFATNGTSVPKPAVKLETSSVGVGCCLRPDAQSGDIGFLVFSCFSDGRNLATQASVPGRRKFSDRGTQVGVGALPPSVPCPDLRDGGCSWSASTTSMADVS